MSIIKKLLKRWKKKDVDVVHHPKYYLDKIDLDIWREAMELEKKRRKQEYIM
jgi:hypothetical protein